jgi:hypothetical protein
MGADKLDLSSSSPASNFDLWLAPCEGFRVTSPEGRVGTLYDVFYEGDRPRLLAVRTGRLGRRLDLFPVEEITEVRFEERCVLLRRYPKPLERRAAARAARGMHSLPVRTAPAPRPGAFLGSASRLH